MVVNRKAFFPLLGILIGLYTGCKELSDFDKFKRPGWLPGKLYTTVLAQSNLSRFAECLRLTGLDTILDVSGSWTVFAPDNEAIERYLYDNQYTSVSQIPKDKLERIIKFHIIQNPWSLEQLKSLTAYGWRTVNDANKTSYAYKRQTMLKKPVEKYWIKRSGQREMIMLDSTLSGDFKKVFVESRKYVPIFYDKYLEINGITSEDFRFYFDREYEWGSVFYAGAKIIRPDIFAENGFVHILDKVVNPMLNAQEILEREMPDETYRLFLEMVYWHYPAFSPNIAATFNQPEVRSGRQVDTLWDLNYTPLIFDLHDELIGTLNNNLVNHNGLFVPTDDAFKTFIDGTLTASSGFPHWNNIRSLPMDVLQFIISQNLKSVPIYPSTQQYKEIFSTSGRYHQNEKNIIRREFGSNCTFIGLNQYIPDRVFTSVTGPVFLRPGFSMFRQAMIYSGVYDQIARYDGELYFFPISDNALRVDSSLILNWTDQDKNQYNFTELNRAKDMIVALGSTTLRNRILNQVGTPVPGGTGNKQMIRTLRGYIITWDQSNNTIQGTLPCTIGYNGLIATTCHTSPLNEPADNGKVWSVGYWFNFK